MTATVPGALDYVSFFFGHFADGGHEYLAPTWLLDPHQVQDKAPRRSRRKLRPCNRRDFDVILGSDSTRRSASWSDAQLNRGEPRKVKARGR